MLGLKKKYAYFWYALQLLMMDKQIITLYKAAL